MALVSNRATMPGGWLEVEIWTGLSGVGIEAVCAAQLTLGWSLDEREQGGLRACPTFIQGRGRLPLCNQFHRDYRG